MEIHSDYRTMFIIYLRIGVLPENKDECERLHRRARQYTLVNDELYRRGAKGTLMKCVTLEEGQVILQDIHVGVYGIHVGAKSLVGKAYR
jgi:hypothetical protein